MYFFVYWIHYGDWFEYVSSLERNFSPQHFILRLCYSDKLASNDADS
jgi:hypothetical protein